MKELPQGESSKSRELNPAVLVSAQILLRRVFRILRGCRIDTKSLHGIIKDALESASEIPASQANCVTAREALICCDVVLKWRRYPKFLDSEGLPAQLSVRDRAPSFVELVEAAAPGTDWQRIAECMTELGVVRYVGSTRIELLSESIVTCSGRDGSIVASELVLEHICGFLGSVEYNVFDKPSRDKGRFERACYASVPAEVVPVLEKLISTRGQEFVDVVDEWLARRSTREGSESGSVLVGAGAYVFVRSNVQ